MVFFKNCFVIIKLYGTDWKGNYEYWMNVGVSEEFGIMRKGQILIHYRTLGVVWL